ncbi:type III toxin-antitoxin system TenpIN family toxin [Floccifex sp.]|uniref:type III toxin-antitoxin system TenpIN family toxin n=1 Tax=Floccifex sp. TaxID=2815810 RepID=UPI003F03035F
MNSITISNNYEIKKLSSNFYKDYPAAKYPEILEKGDRPYDVIVFETKENYYVCVPFRTYLNHKQGFHFYSSPFPTGENPGIDYSKMVIIKKDDYIGETTFIDTEQMSCFNTNIATIQKEVLEYLEGYINHFNGTNTLHPKQFRRKYQFTSLKYFHTELGI